MVFSVKNFGSRGVFADEFSVVHVAVPMLLTSRPQWLWKLWNSILFIEVCSDWQLGSEQTIQTNEISQTTCRLIRVNCSTWVISPHTLSPHQGLRCTWWIFAVTGMSIYMNIFLRQSGTLIGELAPVETTFTDTLSNPFNFFQINTVGFWDGRKWLTARTVFLFLVRLSIYGLSVYGNKVLSSTCYIFFAIRFLSMLMSSCWSLYVFFSIYSVCTLYWYAFRQSQGKGWCWKMWYPNYTT